MDLDGLFGPALPFERDASDVEMTVRPQSLQTLSEGHEGLRVYMEGAQTLRLTGVIHRTTPILWLIDSDGDVWFAMEEVLDVNSGDLTYILPRNGPPMRPRDVRLGHPALLPPVRSGETKIARIGGEINYNPHPLEPNPWVISNNSGRFGKRAHINRSHLENVREVFSSYGIPLRLFFIYTE